MRDRVAGPGGAAPVLTGTGADPGPDYRRSMSDSALAVDGVLLDIDGVLTVDWQPLPGAADAVEALRAARLPFRFCTNTTSRTRVALARALAGAGIPCEVGEIVSAPVATAVHLRTEHPGRPCWLLTSGDVTDDFEGVDLVDRPEDAEVIVLGGAGTVFTYDLLDRTFRQVLAGAAFVAMHRNLTWKVSDGLALDSGAFVLGIEAASGVSPVVIGKPSAAFFAAATTELGTPTDRTVMVGDDLEADVRGAQTAGLRGVLVRTGKFRPSDLERPGPTPDAVIGSVAELPAWLGIAGPAT
jgi:HAD superfamily hydrolase (TIGR01458 family)